MIKQKIVTLDGSSFLISNAAGDIDGGTEDVAGFFFKDMRHLSKWVLTIDGGEPQVLSCDDIEYYFSQHFLAPKTGTIYRNPDLSVARRRMLGEGFLEVLEVKNHSASMKSLLIEIDFDCDFADLFEVKDALEKKGERYQEARGQDWILGYRRGEFVRETRLSFSFPCQISPGKIVAKVDLAPKSARSLEIRVGPITEKSMTEKKDARPGRSKASVAGQSSLRADFEEWLRSAPTVECDVNAIVRAYRRSLVDLAALRFYPDPEKMPGVSVPAAGLPWFMALFGRDSLLTSYQALPFVPELAASTLAMLARMQGSAVDAFRDEEPGKILHELRFGELTLFEEWPQSPYFGSADSTPLYLVLLDEYEKWTGDRELVKRLEPVARGALEWIDKYGDRDGDGFVEYKRALESGLDNQCWKDSWNSILFSDGRVAEAPRAVCEIQGYVYDAKVRCARLAREIWGDAKLAQSLLEQAEELKARFNDRFWIEDRGYYALALDKNKDRVDSLTSNIGHLLWSGIVPQERAKRIADHLMGPRLFSGWGVRTMGEGDAGFNPIEYHNGTVWPHDNSIIAAGLARYGFREAATRISSAIFEASIFFNFRLPEVFAGYAREETQFPVEYPTASSPQAWATGAPLLALRVILGLEASGGQLTSKPLLPEYISELSIRGLKGPWGKRDVEAAHEATLKTPEIVARWLHEREKTQQQ